jgi:hypothetical protein
MSRLLISVGGFSDLVIGSLGLFHPQTSASPVVLFLLGLFCTFMLLLAGIFAEALEQPETIGLEKRKQLHGLR